MESISDQEKLLYVETFNAALCNYDGLKEYLPLKCENIFNRTKDGVVLAALLNHYFPGSIDMNGLKRGLLFEEQADRRYIFEVTANLNLVFSALKSRRELVTVNFGPIDVIQGKEDLIAGLFWQLARFDLLNRVSIQACPELLVLIRDDLTQKCFCKLSKEDVLVKWINYHLSDSARSVNNLARDMSNPDTVATLISKIVPSSDVGQKCNEVVAATAEIKPQLLCEILSQLNLGFTLISSDIAGGHPRIVLATVARLFNKFPGIRLPKADELNLLLSERNSLQLLNDQLASRICCLEQELCLKQTTFDAQANALRGELDMANRMICDLEAKFKAFEQVHREEMELERTQLIQAAIHHEKELTNRFKQERLAVEGKLQLRLRNLVSVGIENSELFGKGEISGIDNLIEAAQTISLALVQRAKQLSIMNNDLKRSLESAEARNELIEMKVKQVAECLINRERETKRK